MSDYSVFEWKLPDAGLNLQYAQDLIPIGQWLRLTNIKSTFEGFIETRPGTSVLLQPAVVPVHTLSRLDEVVIVGAGTGVFRDVTPYTDVFNDPAILSGNPFGFVPYHAEESAETWGYLGSDDVMLKIQADGTVAKWGISPPSVPATAVDAGVGNLDSVCAGTGGCVNYEWFYTYGNSKLPRHESNPSQAPQDALSLNQRKANVRVQASDDPQVDTIYLYRKGGAVKGEFRVKTAPNLTQDIEDNLIDADAVLGEQLFRDNAVPFTVSIGGTFSSGGSTGQSITSSTVEAATPFVWGPFLGSVILACGIPGHEGYVYWTNPGIPDSSDPDNNVEVTGANEFLVNGLIYNGQPFVFSSEQLYALEYGTSDLGVVLGTKLDFRPRLTTAGKGLASPWALCAGPYIWFLSKDGIEQTDSNSPAVSITDAFLRPIFHGRDSAEFKAVDFTGTPMRLTYSQRELHFHYVDMDGERQHLIYHTDQQRWRRAEAPAGVTGFRHVMMIEDISQVPVRQLTGTENGLVLLNDPALSTDATSPTTTTPVEVDIQTGYLDFGSPSKMKEFGGIILDIDAGVDVTVTPFLNVGASTLASVVVPSGAVGVRRKMIVPMDDIYAYTLSLRFQWSGAVRVYQMGILWRLDEEEITHWEYPETSFGLPGLIQMSYGYIAIRSTADVVLTIEAVDSVGTRFVDTYTLPSTSGKKRRVPVFFEPRKFTLARCKLDGVEKFRLYGMDCELYVKPWNTSKGYTRVNPFVGPE